MECKACGYELETVPDPFCPEERVVYCRVCEEVQ